MVTVSYPFPGGGVSMASKVQRDTVIRRRNNDGRREGVRGKRRVDVDLALVLTLYRLFAEVVSCAQSNLGEGSQQKRAW